MDRKTYWNETYLAYWSERVAESSRLGNASTVVDGDAKTEGDDVYERIFKACPFVGVTLLDVGCAWGRMFPLFKQHDLLISGIDISAAMIEKAGEGWRDDPSIKTLREAEAEAIPFEDESFDNVTCLAVFDATYQAAALGEFIRVLRPKGRLYLTGKSHFYSADDRLALEAEIGARRKHHPNYFTNVEAMIAQLQARGHRLLSEFYFPKRGDFAMLNFAEERPERFYEYMIVIERGPDHVAFETFSDPYSATYKAVSNA